MKLLEANIGQMEEFSKLNATALESQSTVPNRTQEAGKF